MYSYRETVYFAINKRNDHHSEIKDEFQKIKVFTTVVTFIFYYIDKHCMDNKPKNDFISTSLSQLHMYL